MMMMTVMTRYMTFDTVMSDDQDLQAELMVAALMASIMALQAIGSLLASSTSTGPRFKLAGAVPLYPRSALDEYARSIITEQSFASTAEAKAARRVASGNSEAA